MLSYIKNSIQLIFRSAFSKIFSILLIATLIQTACNPGMIEIKKYFRIGTGDTQGVYYLAGQAIAQLAQKTPEHGVQVDVQPSSGSVENINALSKRKVQFAFAQSDRAYQAYHAEDYWRHRPQSKLRFVCSFHDEALTLLASDSSRIEVLADLVNKTVSLGAENSSTQLNAMDCLEEANLQVGVDFDRVYISPNELASEMQKSTVDAFFYMAGHPNALCTETSKIRSGVHIVPIEGMSELIARKPYYFPVEISASYYPRMTGPEKVPSIGVRSVLLSSSDVADELVYDLLQILFKNIPELRRKHPSFQVLTPERMVGGAVIPVHPGAERYYKDNAYL